MDELVQHMWNVHCINVPNYLIYNMTTITQSMPIADKCNNNERDNVSSPKETEFALTR